jgi:hypothetical protein
MTLEDICHLLSQQECFILLSDRKHDNSPASEDTSAPKHPRTPKVTCTIFRVCCGYCGQDRSRFSIQADIQAGKYTISVQAICSHFFVARGPSPQGRCRTTRLFTIDCLGSAGQEVLLPRHPLRVIAKRICRHPHCSEMIRKYLEQWRLGGTGAYISRRLVKGTDCIESLLARLGGHVWIETVDSLNPCPEGILKYQGKYIWTLVWIAAWIIAIGDNRTFYLYRWVSVTILEFHWDGSWPPVSELTHIFSSHDIWRSSITFPSKLSIS